MPGDMAEANEPPRAAAERELREELGLELTVGRRLVLEWQPPHGPWDNLLTFVFDGGVLDEDAVQGLTIGYGELCSFDFVPVDDARVRCSDPTSGNALTTRFTRRRMATRVIRKEQPPCSPRFPSLRDDDIHPNAATHDRAFGVHRMMDTLLPQCRHGAHPL